MANRPRQESHLLITGGTGFIGAPLCRRLNEAGYGITVLTRSAQRARETLPAEVNCIESPNALKAGPTIDGLINLAGEPLADRRWNQRRKQAFYASRVGLTGKLYRFFADGSVPAPRVVVSGSAIGYYGPHGDEILTEAGKPSAGFSSELCAAWERAAIEFESLGSRVCLSRTGIVLGDGGALKAMLPVFKLGAGGPLGSGRQWMSWIHIADMVRALEFALEREEVSGPFNATAPAPVSNDVFSKSLARTIHRPCLMRVPAAAMTLLYGEMARELLLSGQRVVPDKLQGAGFEFRYPELTGALEDLLR